MIRRLALLAALALATPAQAQTVTAITGGRVVTNEGPAIEGGTVLIRGDRVVAVGRNVPIPDGAVRIDASGKWVTPGLYAAFSTLGLMEAELEDSANDARVGEADVAAAADASVAFDPEATAIAVTRAEGLTRAMVAPLGGPSPIAGYGLLADLSGTPQSVTKRRAFVFVEAGDVGVARAGRSRATIWPYLDAAFGDASNFPMRFMSHQEGVVLRRTEAEALVPVLRGEIPMLIRVERAADIRQALAFKARRPDLKLVIVGAAEGWEVADELAAAKVPVIIDPMANLPDTFESLSARLDNAALLRKAGVTVALGMGPGTREGHQVRLAPQLAGNAVANGMTWEDGFAAISRAPAEIFGQTDLGVLRAGAFADVVIWDGDPLEVMSAPDAVWLAGARQDLTSRQTLLRDRYRTLRDAQTRPFHYRQE